MKKIKVAIVEDKPQFRDTLKSLLTAGEGIEVLMEADNGEEFLNRLKKAKEFPDVVLLDLRMPVMDGIETQKHLIQLYPDIKTLILSCYDYDDLDKIGCLFDLNINGYLSKYDFNSDLVSAIYEIAQKGYYTNAESARAVQQWLTMKNQAHPLALLTSNEKEVFEHICADKSINEIANNLYKSPRTIEGYKKNILEKLNIKTTVGLVLFAIKNKLLKF